MWQDFRYGARMLLKTPGFTLIAVLTLALGIGANTAIFSVINSVLLRPLPYANPKRLIMTEYRQSVPDLTDIEAVSKSFEAIGGVATMALDYTGGKEPQQIHTALVTSGISHVLGVQPLMGRTFSRNEDRLGGELLTVLTYEFWKNQMKGDPTVIGKTIPLSGKNYTIIGVLRKGFALPLEKVDVWSLVRNVLPDDSTDRGVHFQRTYALLQPDRSLQQAQSEMKLVDRRLEQIDPIENKDRKTILIPLQERIVGDTRPALLILFGAVSLVLLIACSNYANLLLARASSRQQEMLIRTALGAGSQKLLRQMLIESLMLAVPAGLIGLLLAAWGVDILQSLQPENLPRVAEISIDRTVLLFTLSISFLTGILFGSIPAAATIGKSIGDSLKESGRSATSGLGHIRLRRILITGELALSLVLLIGAGLLLKAFYNLQSIDPGFSQNGILTMRIQLPEARYEEKPVQAQFRNTLLQDLNGHSELNAALISELPLTEDWLDHNFIIEGRPPMTLGTEPSLFSRSISGDYFRVMQIPIIQGRAFTAADEKDEPLVGIVNQAMVRKYFPEGNVLGARFRWASDNPPQWISIIGVAGDVKHFGLDQPEEPAVYGPYAQTSKWKRWMNLVVHTAIPAKETLGFVKGALQKLDPQIPITKIQWMSDITTESLERQRYNLLLIGVFAVVALLLAVLGIYGVLSHFVALRTHEIGVRMAVGAGTNAVIGLVVKECLLLIAIGTVIGIGGAFAVTRLMSGLLYGVGTRDPITFASAAVVLSIVGLLAGYFPARRAARVDPMLALRYE